MQSSSKTKNLKTNGRIDPAFTEDNLDHRMFKEESIHRSEANFRKIIHK